MKNKLILLLIFLSVGFSQAQNCYPELHEVYICKNSNGLIETLKIGESEIIYNNGKMETVLILLESQDKSFGYDPISQMPIYIRQQKVQFPKNESLYYLNQKIMATGLSDTLVCQNPDNSIQYFILQRKTKGILGDYYSTNSRGLTEILSFQYDDKNAIFSVLYKTSQKPIPIALKVINPNAAGSCSGIYLINCELQFPNDSRIYKIQFEYGKSDSNGKIKNQAICQNPDGTQQTFVWCRK